MINEIDFASYADGNASYETVKIVDFKKRMRKGFHYLVLMVS